jgi:hypothetical protein
LRFLGQVRADEAGTTQYEQCFRLCSRGNGRGHHRTGGYGSADL